MSTPLGFGVSVTRRVQLARLPVLRPAAARLPIALLSTAEGIGESHGWRRLAIREQIPKCVPAELLAPDAKQSEEARGGCLRISQRVVRTPVRDAQTLAEPLQADGVAQPPHLCGKPRGVDVVRIQRRADRPCDEPSVERVRAVLHEHRALDEAAESLEHASDRRCAVQRFAADSVNATGVRVDPVVAVHEGLEAQQMLLERECDGSELHEVMRRLPSRLAIECHKTELLDGCVGRRSLHHRRVVRILQGGERLRPRRSEPGHKLVAGWDRPPPASVAPLLRRSDRAAQWKARRCCAVDLDSGLIPSNIYWVYPHVFPETRPLMRVVAAGVSFQTAPLPVLEAASVREDDARGLLRYLVGHAGFSGAAVLSTCNRTEFYLSCDDAAAADVAARLAPHIDPDDRHHLARHLSVRTDSDCVLHLFRVAAGLESMVVGEAQVLGQLRRAHDLARSAGSLDARLDFLLRRAISVGKAVRSHTPIGRGAGSLSQVAVDCAREVAGRLSERGVLLVGAGKMSALAARRLREEGARLFTTSRGTSKDRLADSSGAVAVRLESLVDHAHDFDVIVCSTTSSAVVLEPALVAAIQNRRDHRPLCIVDIAVPRDVDPECAALDGVTLIDIEELGRRLDGHLRARDRHVPEAEALIEQELHRTAMVIGERDAAGPTITALTRRAEAIRRRELERTLARAPEVDAVVRERIDVLTQSLVRKLLHGPISHLRRTAADPAVALVLRDAFDLDADVELRGYTRSPDVEDASAR